MGKSVWIRSYEIKDADFKRDLTKNLDDLKAFGIDTFFIQFEKDADFDDADFRGFITRINRGFSFYISFHIERPDDDAFISARLAVVKGFCDSFLSGKRRFRGIVLDYIRFMTHSIKHIFQGGVVQKVIARYRSEFPNLSLGCTIFPFPESYLLGQNPGLMRKSCDFFMPMLYSQQNGIPRGFLTRLWLRFSIWILGLFNKVIPILQAYYDPKENPLRTKPFTYVDIKKQVDFVAGKLGRDVSLYRAGTFLELKRK